MGYKIGLSVTSFQTYLQGQVVPKSRGPDGNGLINFRYEPGVWIDKKSPT